MRGDSSLQDVKNVLQADGVAVLPTETVYGLGANAYSERAVLELFRRKGRSFANPISVCYANLDAASQDVEIDDIARRLAGVYMPGPLTLVLPIKTATKIAKSCSAGFHTIGLRIPDNYCMLQLLKEVSFPIALTSANKSGEQPATTAEAAFRAVGLEGDAVLDDGESTIGVASTVVDLTNGVKILREGAIESSAIFSTLSAL